MKQSTKFQNNQAGFGAEVVLVIIVVVLLAVLGFLFYKRNHKANTSVTTTKTATVAQPTNSPNTSVTTVTHGSQEGVTLIQTTYDNFVAARDKANADKSNTTPVAQAGLTAIKNNLTPDFYTKAAAVIQATPFTCTSQYASEQYTASLKSSDKKTAVVALVISNSADGKSTTSGMTATVDLTTLKITDVSCPN